MLLAGMLHVLTGWTLSITSVFIILLVLVQRGRGGGLAGALGGLGGQSAFGTKAGDNFTRVTMIAASVWILLCVLSLKTLSSTSHDAFAGSGGPRQSQLKSAPTETEKSTTSEPATESTTAAPPAGAASDAADSGAPGAP